MITCPGDPYTFTYICSPGVQSTTKIEICAPGFSSGKYHLPESLESV